MPSPGRSPGLRRNLCWIVLVLSAGVLQAGGLAAARAADPSAGQTALRELRGFRELGSVLYVAAHPDDENTQLIAALARGRGYRTAYLSLTRGDGGQNVIGPELFEELGVIRTQELLAAPAGRRPAVLQPRNRFRLLQEPAGNPADLEPRGGCGRHRACHPGVPSGRGDHALLTPGGWSWPPHRVRHPDHRGLPAGGRPQRASRRARAGSLETKAPLAERRRVRRRTWCRWR